MGAGRVLLVKSYCQRRRDHHDLHAYSKFNLLPCIACIANTVATTRLVPCVLGVSFVNRWVGPICSTTRYAHSPTARFVLQSDLSAPCMIVIVPVSNLIRWSESYVSNYRQAHPTERNITVVLGCV